MGNEEVKERILYVEDEHGVRTAGARNLERKGYEVIVAKDGQEALEAYRREDAEGRTIDLVITDINMPNLNGLRLVEKLRDEEMFKGPIAFCTGSILPAGFNETYGIIADCTLTTAILKAYEQWKVENEK